MAKIRIRIELNKGRVGVPLDKLAAISAVLEDFLRVVAEDIGIPKERNLWLAKDFANGSAIFTAEMGALAEVERATRFNQTIEAVSNLGGAGAARAAYLSREVLSQYTKLAAPLAIDEQIGFGIFDSDEVVEPRWVYGAKINAVQALPDAQEESATYYGSILGSIHLLNKGHEPPFFQVRELVSGDLVKVEYRPSDYKHVAALLQDNNALVYVYGTIIYSRPKRAIEQMNGDRYEPAPTFTDEDYAKFFGCAPKLGGNKTGAELIRKSRNGVKAP